MRIGLSSIVGDGFGNGSFSFGEVPSGGGIPSGVAYTAYGVIYPIAEGGANIQITELGGDYPSQICDVDYVYEAFPPYQAVVDWSSARNIAYRPNGSYIAGDATPTSQTPVEVPFESGIYFDSEYVTEYAALAEWDGGYTWTPYGVGYWDADTFIYYNGDFDLNFYWDGSGDYYSSSP